MNLQLVAPAPVTQRKRRSSARDRIEQRLKLLDFEVRKVGPDWRLDCWVDGELAAVFLGQLSYVTRCRWYISTETAKGLGIRVIIAVLPQVIGGTVCQ